MSELMSLADVVLVADVAADDTDVVVVVVQRLPRPRVVK